MSAQHFVILLLLLYTNHPAYILGNSAKNDTLHDTVHIHDAVHIISILNSKEMPEVNLSNKTQQRISSSNVSEIRDTNLSYDMDKSAIEFNFTSLDDPTVVDALPEIKTEKMAKETIPAIFYDHLVQRNKSEDRVKNQNVSLEMLQSFITPAVQLETFPKAAVLIHNEEREVNAELRKSSLPSAESQRHEQDVLPAVFQQWIKEDLGKEITKTLPAESTSFQTQNKDSVKSEVHLIYGSPEVQKELKTNQDGDIAVYKYQDEETNSTIRKPHRNDAHSSEARAISHESATANRDTNIQIKGAVPYVAPEVNSESTVKEPEELMLYTVPENTSDLNVTKLEVVPYSVPVKDYRPNVEEKKIALSYNVPEKAYESAVKEVEEILPYKTHEETYESGRTEIPTMTEAPKADIPHYTYDQNDIKSIPKDKADNWTVQDSENTVFHSEWEINTEGFPITHIEDLPQEKPSHSSHPCARTCREGSPPLQCNYTFTLEWYYTMSKACHSCPMNVSDCYHPDCITADGVKRPVTVVNRMLPGPSIEVCLGDTITVDVNNMMMGESTTIHWHGHHQRGTPYMDGVPFVTQCPIPPKTSFRYQYTADSPGTHFWHSHTGCQRADGVFGAFIVRSPASQDPHSKLYDFDLSEHIIQILDWGYEIGLSKFLAHHHSDGDNKPFNILVNGRGRYFHHQDIVIDRQNEVQVPVTTFTVQQGYKYRFRLINAGFLNCPIEMSVDNHTFTVIGSDGFDIRPVQAVSLVSYAGERFDFILNANQAIGNYWIRFRGLMDCDERFTSAHQVAILHYDGAPENEEPRGEVTYEASHRKGRQVNSLNVGTGTKSSLVIPELDALTDDAITLKDEPDMRFYVSYDFYELDNPHFHRAPYYGFHQVKNTTQLYTPQLNHISLHLPPFPLLSQYNDLSQEHGFCNESTVTNCENKFCKCTHVVQIPLGTVLELILIDKGVTYDANHPFHLHGNAFRVIAMERLGSSTTVEEVQRLDDAGAIKRKLHYAPIKDTVTVPDGGYTIVRVHATNPGYWLFHCHIEFHAEVGMALVFKVGEHTDFPPVPRGFPVCGNYFPSEDQPLDMYEIVTPINSSIRWQAIKTAEPSSAFQVYPRYIICLIILLCSSVVR